MIASVVIVAEERFTNHAMLMREKVVTVPISRTDGKGRVLQSQVETVTVLQAIALLNYRKVAHEAG